MITHDPSVPSHSYLRKKKQEVLMQNMVSIMR